MGRKLSLDGVPETRISSGRWQPLNERLGIRNFGISAVVMDPGDEFDIEHDEAEGGHQEVYLVVSGRVSAWETRSSRPAPATSWRCPTPARRATTGRWSRG